MMMIKGKEMKKYQLTINQRIIGDSADTWVETYNTYASAEERLNELTEKMRKNYDRNYSIEVLNGIEIIQGEN